MISARAWKFSQIVIRKMSKSDQFDRLISQWSGISEIFSQVNNLIFQLIWYHNSGKENTTSLPFDAFWHLAHLTFVGFFNTGLLHKPSSPANLACYRPVSPHLRFSWPLPSLPLAEVLSFPLLFSEAKLKAWFPQEVLANVSWTPIVPTTHCTHKITDHCSQFVSFLLFNWSGISLFSALSRCCISSHGACLSLCPSSALLNGSHVANVDYAS